DAAASGSPAHHDGPCRDGRRHRPAPARLLRPAGKSGADDRSVGRPGAGRLWSGLGAGAPLGRAEGRGRGMSDDLWTWACAAYAAPGVSEACLSLQDYHEQNVPLLLWAAWTAVTGRRPDEETIE